MVSAHYVLAVAVIAAAVVAGVLGAGAHLRRREPGPVVAHLLTLVQTLLVAQVALGLLLLSGERRSGDDLHYAYGTLALAAVLSPWFYAPREPRRRLLWFAVAALLAGALAVRAYMTG